MKAGSVALNRPIAAVAMANEPIRVAQTRLRLIQPTCCRNVRSWCS